MVVFNKLERVYPIHGEESLCPPLGVSLDRGCHRVPNAWTITRVHLRVCRWTGDPTRFQISGLSLGPPSNVSLGITHDVFVLKPKFDEKDTIDEDTILCVVYV